MVEQERQVLAAHRAAVVNAQAAANRATTLRVGMPLAVNPAFLLGVAERFGREYPSVAVVPVTRKRSEMPRALANGEVEIVTRDKSVQKKVKVAEAEAAVAELLAE